MLAGQQSFMITLQKALIAGLILSLAASCTIVKKYPENKPFIYQTNINVISDTSKVEKDLLADRLENQLDDSVRPRSVSRLLWRVMKNPPVYDVANADKSVIFMKALLVSLGYFYDSTSYRAKIDSSDSAHGKFPVTLTFDVIPGQVTRIDSLTYNLDTPLHNNNQVELQKITDDNLKDALVKKGNPFSKAPVGLELERLVELYRNNGYFRFTREEMIGVWDTLNIALLQPSLDPFEQVEVLQKLAQRRQNPTANLEIRLKPGFDSAKLGKYYVGNVNLYPDYTADTIGKTRTVTEVDTALYVIQHRNTFKPKIFPVNVYLRHGEVYRQRRYQRTINRFNNIGAWKLVNIAGVPRVGQDTVDFHIHLTPGLKYVFTTNLELSQNNSAVSGSLLGIGINVGVQDRNLARSANLASTNLRYNIEFGSKFIQSQQIILSHSISFPRPVILFKKFFFKKFIPERLQDEIRTIFAFSGGNTERRDLYNLTTINGSWGYDFQRNIPRTENSIGIFLKLPNIEYSYLRRRDSLDKLIAANPALKNIFTDGFVSSIVTGATYSTVRNDNQNVYATNIEESGLITGLIPSKFLDSQLYRYLKLNVEFTRLMKYNRSAFALRAFAGIGYEFNSTVNPDKRNNLPFFKQYYAGGPNSMRAWRLRRLGPGSVIKDYATTPERYGDVQLEVNAEYRYPYASLGGMKLMGAVFIDIGNIWFLKKEAGLPEEVFNFGRLWEDLGIGVGTGVRIDFTFFLLRVDYAFKAKDPSPDPQNAAGQNKWFYNFKPFAGQLQIGINYPFKL
ncbi:MAG TPA: BamA/TamA family outer membrane protein [Chitinophagaceae bacterium]